MTACFILYICGDNWTAEPRKVRNYSPNEQPEGLNLRQKMFCPRRRSDDGAFGPELPNKYKKKEKKIEAFKAHFTHAA